MEILNKVKDWFKSSSSYTNDVEKGFILKYLVFLLPLYGITYLVLFYDSFGINYLEYINPTDFLITFFRNNAIYLIALVLSGFMFLYFKIINENEQESKTHNLENRLIVTYWFVINAFFACLSLIGVVIVLKLFLAFFVISTVVAGFFLYSKKYSSLFWSFLCAYVFYTLYQVNAKVSYIKGTKPKFEIILQDNTYLLRENEVNSYYIGSTTEYVFIYSNLFKKNRIIPKSQIKEIRI